MGMVVTLFLALAATILTYTLGHGGPVAGLVFAAVLLVGVVMRVAQPKA